MGVYISFLLDMKVSPNQPMHSDEIALEVTPKSPWLNRMQGKMEMHFS